MIERKCPVCKEQVAIVSMNDSILRCLHCNFMWHEIVLDRCSIDSKRKGSLTK